MSTNEVRRSTVRLLAAEPGNSVPGLVLADWLQEQGSPEEHYWRDPALYATPYTVVVTEHGFGDGDGDGDGYGYIRGYGDGYGCGYGDGDGCGCGYGDGDGDGDGGGDGGGDGYIRGYGGGDGYIRGYGGGYIRGYGYGFRKQEILMNGRCVLVCDKGFVLVGVVRPNPDDWLRVIVDECSTVRRWGTSTGLGELARNGPLRDTVLDYEGDGVDLLRATVLRAIPCDEAKWKGGAK